MSSSKDPGDEKAVKVIGDVIVDGIVKVNGIYPYCSPCAAMRGANAARQRFSVQRMLHQGRIFRQGFSANLAGAGNVPMPAQKMWGVRGGSREFFCPKEKMGVDAKCTNRAEHV